MVEQDGEFSITKQCEMLSLNRTSLYYKPRPRLKVLKESFRAQDYNVRGLKAGGIRLAAKEAEKADSR